MWDSMRILNGRREAQNIPIERIRIRKIIMSLTKAKVKISPKGNIRNIQKIREPVKKKKKWKIPHLGGGSGPGHFPHFKKKKKKIKK